MRRAHRRGELDAQLRRAGIDRPVGRDRSDARDYWAASLVGAQIRRLVEPLWKVARASEERFDRRVTVERQLDHLTNSLALVGDTLEIGTRDRIAHVVAEVGDVPP